MKQLKVLTIALLAIGCLAMPLTAAEAQSARTPSIRVINFKVCVELSKYGKHEQGAFDGLKKQMETVLGEKEKVLKDMATKMEDPDYRDSLTPEAETDLTRKFRSLDKEFTQIQTQYYQTLQQANYKILQKLQDFVTKAANKVALQMGIDLVLNEEGCFYASRELDISSQVVAMLDKMYDEDEASKAQEGKGQLPIPSKGGK